VLLGECCGYRGDDLAQLGQAALLHDIGKILIPDSLLLKPGRLSEPEMRIVQQHPHRGYRFLRRFPHLRKAALVALCHHERIDAAGYPLRLRGQEIPLNARITMVADALDVIMSGRSYSPARSLAAARAEVLRCAGTQFDRDVVDVFLQVPDEQWKFVHRNCCSLVSCSTSSSAALP
jgi:HD-GYP domain-containing protein (c-di-GMP phosphodiesterase class II)